MSNRSPEGAEPDRLEELPLEELPLEELPLEELELLARAREQRRRESVPFPVRERLFARALEEAGRADPIGVVPAAQLVTVPPRGFGFALRWAGALALGVVLLGELRGWLGARREQATDGASSGAAELAADAVEPVPSLGGRLFQSALFRAPAPAFGAALPSPESSLLGERPFSSESRAWQVRRWDDLSVAPGGPASFEVGGGALCVALGQQERVLGGWPWVSAGEGTAAPRPVRLEKGKGYRLVFRAWAQEPLPAQVLIAVGHAGVPFSAAAGARVAVTTKPQAFAVNFVAAYGDPSIGVAFLATAADAGERTRLCLSDVTLTDGAPR